MNLTRSSLCGLLLSFTVAANAQSLPPIFADTPKQLVDAVSVAAFPVGTFLENLVVGGDGTLFVKSLEEGVVYAVTPGGKTREFARSEGRIAGITFSRTGKMLVTGWARDDVPTVFRVSRQGVAETLASLNDAVFLNGIARLRGDRYLIADSYKGVIWEFDERTRRHRVWSGDGALARSDVQSTLPGVNGLKLFKGALYATNTERQQFLRIPVRADGSAGDVQVLCPEISGDDFAVGTDGAFYVTTHVYNSVVRVSRSCGDVTILAEGEEGVTGSTALAFGRGKAGRQDLFVIRRPVAAASRRRAARTGYAPRGRSNGRGVGAPLARLQALAAGFRTSCGRTRPSITKKVAL